MSRPLAMLARGLRAFSSRRGAAGASRGVSIDDQAACIRDLIIYGAAGVACRPGPMAERLCRGRRAAGAEGQGRVAGAPAIEPRRSAWLVAGALAAHRRLIIYGEPGPAAGMRAWRRPR
jgi:hypothetical protein